MNKEEKELYENQRFNFDTSFWIISGIVVFLYFLARGEVFGESGAIIFIIGSVLGAISTGILFAVYAKRLGYSMVRSILHFFLGLYIFGPILPLIGWLGIRKEFTRRAGEKTGFFGG